MRARALVCSALSHTARPRRCLLVRLQPWTGVALALGACSGVQPRPPVDRSTPLTVAAAERPPRETVAAALPAMAASSEPIEAAPRPASPRARSRPLQNGLHNPLPGGVMAGYRADTGLDIASPPRPVFAIAAGRLDYAEAGHTLWVGRRDSPYTVRIELDEPIPYKGRMVTHVWYAHLSELSVTQPEGQAPRARIAAGEQLGVSGTARGSPHLHLGLLLDGDVSQSWGTFLLEDEVRAVLGGWRRGARLP